MEEWEGEEEVEHQEEQEIDEGYEMEEDMEGMPGMEETKDDDSNYDWYGPSGGNEPIAAPELVPIAPIRQKGPAKFIPLNMGGGKYKGKGKKGVGKGKNKGKGKGFPAPYLPFMPRPPMGHMTPITHPMTVVNPLHQQQQWKGGRTKGWIPPVPPTPQMAMRVPPMQGGAPNMTKMPGMDQNPGQVIIPPTIPQMIPFYGFTPFPVAQQQQPMGPCQSMEMPSQPQTESQDKTRKPVVAVSVKRKRRTPPRKREAVSPRASEKKPTRCG